MKNCSLNNFMKEINLWMDKEYIKKAVTNGEGKFIVYFLDGTMNTYLINDCNEEQVVRVLRDLKTVGIAVEH